MILAPFALCLLPLLAIAIKREDGGSIFYVSRRMANPHRSFGLVKFRTMRDSPSDAGVTGGDKTERITRTGSKLRKYRLDELPQLWNIARGDVSFVGPRPPLPSYVATHQALYEKVLRSKPGLTGLATLVFHRREAELLRRGTTRAETEAIYVSRCIPRKARLDLIYARNRSLAFDLWIILATFKVIFTKRG